MDVATLSEAIKLVASAVSTVKQAKDLIPDSPEKDEAETALQEAERKLKLAESKVATNLGYEICRAHFPPEVMLEEKTNLWKCPECGNEKDTSWEPPPPMKSRWKIH